MQERVQAGGAEGLHLTTPRPPPGAESKSRASTCTAQVPSIRGLLHVSSEIKPMRPSCVARWACSAMPELSPPPKGQAQGSLSAGKRGRATLTSCFPSGRSRGGLGLRPELGVQEDPPSWTSGEGGMKAPSLVPPSAAEETSSSSCSEGR